MIAGLSGQHRCCRHSAYCQTQVSNVWSVFFRPCSQSHFRWMNAWVSTIWQLFNCSTTILYNGSDLIYIYLDEGYAHLAPLFVCYGNSNNAHYRYRWRSWCSLLVDTGTSCDDHWNRSGRMRRSPLMLCRPCQVCQTRQLWRCCSWTWLSVSALRRFILSRLSINQGILAATAVHYS